MTKCSPIPMARELRDSCQNQAQLALRLLPPLSSGDDVAMLKFSASTDAH